MDKIHRVAEVTKKNEKPIREERNGRRGRTADDGTRYETAKDPGRMLLYKGKGEIETLLYF